MRRVISTVLVLAMAAFVSPIPVVVAQGQTGAVTGTAADASKNPLANHTVRIRNVATGQTTTTTSAANGTFSFAGVTPGNYVIEIVNAAGNVIGASSSVAVAAGATATVTVTATAVAAAAAAAAGGAGLAGVFTGTSLIVVTAAGVAGIAIAVTATQDDEASPSR